MKLTKQKKQYFWIGLGACLIFLVLFIGAVTMAYRAKITHDANMITMQTDAMSPTPSTGPIGMPNPASVNCVKQGGTSRIETRGDGGQYGICDFGSGQYCEEWALMQGECPVGGVKTTGFTTRAQVYCAILGGQTLAVPNAQCTFKNGRVCPVEDLYQGICTPYEK